MSATCWRAPGRVNLVGEHTDYNAGFVLPFALEQGCTARVDRRGDRQVVVISAQRPDPVRLDDARQLRPTGGWADYPLGVLWALQRQGHDLPGLTIRLDGDVPLGAGLSSSAALVCSVATAVDDLLGLRLAADELLELTRHAENDFVGAPTGGMDQLVALRGRAGHALFCDMRSLYCEPVPLGPVAARLLVIDTRAPHRHTDGEYRRRRLGCERAAAELGVTALRDIDVAGLDDALGRLSDGELRGYVRHIVTENDRVLATAAALRAGRTAQVGRLLTASHLSMRDDFRICTPEVDTAVDALLSTGALGARMTGGGFGGCVIALLDGPDGPGARDAAVAAVRDAFAARGYARPVVVPARPSDGARRVSAADEDRMSDAMSDPDRPD